MREEIANPKRYIRYVRRRSTIVEGEHLAKREYMVFCPKCRKKHWWGNDKKHHCKACDLWVLATCSSEFVPGPGPWPANMMSGDGWFVPVLVIADSKENLKNQYGTYLSDEVGLWGALDRNIDKLRIQMRRRTNKANAANECKSKGDDHDQP